MRERLQVRASGGGPGPGVLFPAPSWVPTPGSQLPTLPTLHQPKA